MHVPGIPSLTSVDPVLARHVEAEAQRQHESIRLIASENYVSRAVLEA
jgi:glycine hydroxymethyltransferase